MFGNAAMQCTEKRFELWLPFTASAIGVAEDDLPAVHNRPMKQVLERINRSSSTWECSTIYFTENRKPFTHDHNGLTTQFFPTSFRKRSHSKTFGRQWSFSAFQHLLLNPPDFVGFYGGSGHFTTTAAQVCRLRRIPYYVHFGGWPVPLGKQYQRMMHDANFVITFTERQRLWMMREGIYIGGNMASWSMGVDTRTFQHCHKDRSQERKGPRLLYVGRITHNKGVLEAVQALRAIRTEFPNAMLDIIGSLHDEPFIRKIQGYLEEHTLEDVVSLRGAVPYEELPQWYAAADLFIFPSPLESFGFVVVESMACGTPVVALRGSGGPEEIITHRVDGILTDLPNLALEAIGLLSNPEHMKQMGDRAVEKINEKYTMEQTVAKLLSLLDKSLEAS